MVNFSGKERKMNQQIKKNKLDLEHNKYTQILNAVFIFLTTGILSFAGSFIFLEDKNKLAIGVSISVLLLIVGYAIYKKINSKLNKIIKEIENL